MQQLDLTGSRFISVHTGLMTPEADSPMRYNRIFRAYHADRAADRLRRTNAIVRASGKMMTDISALIQKAPQPPVPFWGRAAVE